MCVLLLLHVYRLYTSWLATFKHSQRISSLRAARDNKDINNDMCCNNTSDKDSKGINDNVL